MAAIWLPPTGWLQTTAIYPPTVQNLARPPFLGTVGTLWLMAIIPASALAVTLPASWETCMQVKKQQLEPNMEQQTGSKLGKEYIRLIYCHPDYSTYMQSISCEMLGWTKHKLESRLLGEISITSDMQMTPPLWHKVKRNSKASWWKWKRRVKKLA